MSLKKEVQHLKSQLSATSDMSLGAVLKPSSALDSSYSTRVRGKSVVRDPNDIKKIEDLKQALREMQESINKRYPDSVATLIQASKLSDSVQAKHDDTEKNLQESKDELLKARQEFERRLRSLRQEHEKVKLQYEERIKNLQATGGVSKTEGAVRHLPAANLKIKELEKEVERLRTFYTKKIEETQRKADAQLRSLKRGDKEEGLEGVSVLPEAIVQQYETRIELLEKELFATAEELGRAKAIASATEIKVLQQAAIPLPTAPPAAFTADAISLVPTPTPPPPPPSLPSPAVLLNATVPADYSAVLESLRQAKVDTDNQVQTIINLNTKIAEITSELNVARLDLADQKSRVAMLTSEKDSSQAQLDNIRSELHAKQLEIANHLKDASSNSQSLQLASVERKVKILEDKILRREEELQAMIEETRAAAKIERSRLKSIHEQELFEKDDQLRKFQYQLEDLVDALRKQSLAVSMGPTSLSTVLISET
jgi:chromosome segregation ATPase